MHLFIFWPVPQLLCILVGYATMHTMRILLLLLVEYYYLSVLLARVVVHQLVIIILLLVEYAYYLGICTNVCVRFVVLEYQSVHNIIHTTSS